MANHPSAEKRHRQNLKKRARNRSARSEIRTSIKSALQAAKSGDKDTASSSLKTATSLLGKASVKGLHHKNNVARRVSRLTKAVDRLLVESANQ
jgi:small subunit ribosomal protein S20